MDDVLERIKATIELHLRSVDVMILLRRSELGLGDPSLISHFDEAHKILTNMPHPLPSDSFEEIHTKRQDLLEGLEKWRCDPAIVQLKVETEDPLLQRLFRMRRQALELAIAWLPAKEQQG